MKGEGRIEAPPKRRIKPVTVYAKDPEGTLLPTGITTKTLEDAIKAAQDKGPELQGKPLVAVKVCAEFELVANPAFKVVKK